LSALASWVVWFWCGSAIFFRAAAAWALLSVKLLFVLFPHFQQWGNLVALGREDDGPNYSGMILKGLRFFVVHEPLFIGIAARGARLRFLFALRLMQRPFLQIDFAGAEEAVEGVGEADVDALVIERGDDDGKVELEGGAVFGKDEGERFVEAVRVGFGRDFGKGGFDDLVVSAIERFVHGGLGTAASGGEQVTANIMHNFFLFPLFCCV
jgi:hypothetical protein